MCVYLLVRLNRFSMWCLTTYRLYVSSGNHFAGPYSIHKLWVCITNDMLIHLHAMFSVHSLFFFRFLPMALVRIAYVKACIGNAKMPYMSIKSDYIHIDLGIHPRSQSRIVQIQSNGEKQGHWHETVSEAIFSTWWKKTQCHYNRTMYFKWATSLWMTQAELSCYIRLNAVQNAAVYLSVRNWCSRRIQQITYESSIFEQNSRKLNGFALDVYQHSHWK